MPPLTPIASVKMDSSDVTASKVETTVGGVLEAYDDDDMYVLPLENYSKMNINRYTELMLSRENLSASETNTFTAIAAIGCQVYFVDECTSMLYQVVSGEETEDTDLIRETILVLFDFYDSFLDKIEFY